MSGKAVRETLGFVAVVAGLLFVGMEIQQNTVATRAVTQQAIFDSGTEMNINVMTNERLRDLRVGALADPSGLDSGRSPSDDMLLRHFYLTRFNFVENAFYHVSHGTVDAEYWSGIDGWMRSVVGDAVHRHYWDQLEGAYGADFIAYMNDAIAEAPGA